MGDKYKDKRAEYQRRHKKKALNEKWGITNPNLVDYYLTKIVLPTPVADKSLSKWCRPIYIREKVDEIVFEAQKQIRKEWAHRGNTNNIIIISEGVSNKSTITYKCEIHQLKMDKEKTKEFEDVCKTILETINNNYQKEKQNEEM